MGDGGQEAVDGGVPVMVILVARGEGGTSVRYLVEEFARMCDGWKQGLAGGWYMISAALDSTCSLHLLRVRDGKSAAGGGVEAQWNGI